MIKETIPRSIGTKYVDDYGAVTPTRGGDSVSGRQRHAVPCPRSKRGGAAQRPPGRRRASRGRCEFGRGLAVREKGTPLRHRHDERRLRDGRIGLATEREKLDARALHQHPLLLARVRASLPGKPPGEGVRVLAGLWVGKVGASERGVELCQQRARRRLP
eukprot:scaffold36274_cov125-Isochrysis_galbana.AAC.13